MKTFKERFTWGIVGAMAGLLMGYAVCAFISGTFDPFSIRIYWSNGGNIEPIRQWGIESFARMIWVFVILGSSAGCSCFAVWIYGKK